MSIFGYGTITSDTDVPAVHGVCPARGWDYVLVFEGPGAGEGAGDAEEQAAQNPSLARANAAREKVLDRLRSAGFAYGFIWDPAESRVLVCFGLPDDTLMEKAEAVGMDLELKPRYGGGYLAFTVGRSHVFVNDYRVAKGLPYFYRSDIIIITLAVLSSREVWGAGIDAERLVHNRILKQAYPVHDIPTRNSLVDAAVFRPWYSRLRERTLTRLKRYLGAGVTLYVAFLAFYSRMLTGIAVASIPVTLIINYSSSITMVAWARCLFGLCVIFWATYFLEYWKRRCAVLGVKWGLSDVKEDTAYEVRPQFAGIIRKGFYCGGGFVHLDDLDEHALAGIGIAASEQASADASAPSSPVVNRVVATAGDGFLRTTMSEFDPSSPEGDDDDPPSIPDVLRLGAAVSARDDNQVSAPNQSSDAQKGFDDVEPPPATKPAKEIRNVVKGSVLIGGKSDEMFKLEAVATGVTFPNLPSTPMCSKHELNRRAYIGAAVTAFFAALVGLCQFLLLYYRADMLEALSRGITAPIAHLVPGVVTGFFISTCDGIWRNTTVSLTNWENHRTNSSQENSLVVKRFAFQFVSNYSSLFYIAFVKPHTAWDPCVLGDDGKTPDCMMELQSQLIGMVVTKATMMQFMEVGVPFIMGRFNMWRQRAARASLGEELSDEERERLSAAGAVIDEGPNKYLSQSKLEPHYTPMNDYGELVISYGYFCLFGLCWPLAALVQALDVAVETRSDVFKILVVSQMPNSREAADIGMWLPIMEFLRTMSVVTNAALITFTGNSLGDMIPDSWEPSPILAFLLLEHVLILIKRLITTFVNQVPGRTKRLLARQEYLIARWFDVGWRPCFQGASDDL